MKPEEAKAVVKEVTFKDGLVPAIARDAENKDILMVGWMNEEALEKTLTTGRMTYWSRSRGKLWRKGEESGHFQTVKGVWIDCDGDVLLFDIDQKGSACHKGYRSCFYRKLEKGEFVEALEKDFDPSEVYG